MSEHLANLGILRDVIRMHQPAQASHDSTLELILLELVNRIEHLEAQQETPASASQSTEQPVPSSSEATETEPEMSDTWSTSRQWSFPVKADGSTAWSARQAIWDWFNSQAIPGNVQEVEIGVTLTSKASTPPGGLRSPLTGGLTRGASGRAGDRIEQLADALYYGTPAPEPSPAPSHEAREGRDPETGRIRGCTCLIQGYGTVDRVSASCPIHWPNLRANLSDEARRFWEGAQD